VLIRPVQPNLQDRVTSGVRDEVAAPASQHRVGVGVHALAVWVVARLVAGEVGDDAHAALGSRCDQLAALPAGAPADDGDVGTARALAGSVSADGERAVLSGEGQQAVEHRRRPRVVPAGQQGDLAGTAATALF
jgi:hypothetical protein